MKKIIVLLMLVFLLLPCLALAEQPPLTKEEIKAFVVPNLVYVTSRSEISLEITDKGNYFKDYRDGREYLGYANLVYILMGVRSVEVILLRNVDNTKEG